MFHVKQRNVCSIVSRETFFIIFVYENLFAIANRFCRGAAPADPAKGVPPFGTLLRGLRAQDSAVKEKNNFRIRTSREKALDNFDFSPFLRILVSQRKHLTL